MKIFKNLICLLFLVLSLNVSASGCLKEDAMHSRVNVSGCLSEGPMHSRANVSGCLSESPMHNRFNVSGCLSEGAMPRRSVKVYHGLYDRKSRNVLKDSVKRLKRRAMKIDKISINLKTDRSRLDDLINLLNGKEACIINLEIGEGKNIGAYFFTRKYVYVEYLENGEICGYTAYSDGEILDAQYCSELSFLDFIFNPSTCVSPMTLVRICGGIFKN